MTPRNLPEEYRINREWRLIEGKGWRRIWRFKSGSNGQCPKKRLKMLQTELEDIE